MNAINDFKYCNVNSYVQKIGLRCFTIYHVSPRTTNSQDISSFISFLSSLVQANAIIVISGTLKDYGLADEESTTAYDEFHLRELANSITDCMVLELSNDCLKAMFDFEHGTGYLVGSKNTCKYVCSVAGLKLSETNHGASVDICVAEFDAFKHLWDPPLDPMELIETGVEQHTIFMCMVGIGKVLGTLHSRRILHGDAHLANFVMDESGHVVTVDVKHFRPLLRDLKSEECASDLVPMLAEVSSHEWSWFKIGYLTEFGERASFVVNLIEKGQELRWIVYFQSGKYDKALEVLLEELRGSKDDENRDLSNPYNNIGACYSRLGEHEKAIESYKAARRIQECNDDPDIAITEHNIGMAYCRKKDFTNAIKSFENVISLNNVSSPKFINVYWSSLFHLAESYERIEQFKPALEYIDKLIDFVQKSESLDLDIEGFRNKRDELAKRVH